MKRKNVEEIPDLLNCSRKSGKSLHQLVKQKQWIPVISLSRGKIFFRPKKTFYRYRHAMEYFQELMLGGAVIIKCGHSIARSISMLTHIYPECQGLFKKKKQISYKDLIDAKIYLKGNFEFFIVFPKDAEKFQEDLYHKLKTRRMLSEETIDEPMVYLYKMFDAPNTI